MDWERERESKRRRETERERVRVREREREKERKGKEGEITITITITISIIIIKHTILHLSHSLINFDVILRRERVEREKESEGDNTLSTLSPNNLSNIW